MNQQQEFKLTPAEIRLIQVWRTMKNRDQEAMMRYSIASVRDDPRRPALRLISGGGVTRPAAH